MFPGLDMYCTDPAQHPITTGWALDDRDCYLFEVWNIDSVHVSVGIYCTQAEGVPSGSPDDQDQLYLSVV